MRRRAAEIALILASILVALALGEVTLRLAGIDHPNFYMFDRERGAVLLPGAEGWQNEEGAAFIRVNSAGFRDSEHTRNKPPGTYRIAVLGDSYVEAMQVPVERAFWKVMETRLGGCALSGGRRVEVLAFGVSGYGTGEALLTLRQAALGYAPDLVMLAVTTGNDIRDNSRALSGQALKPYFMLRDGALELDTAFRESWSARLRASRLGQWHYRLLRHSRLWQVAVRALRKDGGAPAANNPGGAAGGGGAIDNPDGALDQDIYRPPDDPARHEAWRVTEALIDRIKTESRAARADFIAATLSNPAQVHPDPARRRALAQRLGVVDLSYPDRRIAELGRAAGFATIPLAPALGAVSEARNLCLHGFKPGECAGHWNREGHRLAGETLARMLCAGVPAP